jgi:hypothetical protein
MREKERCVAWLMSWGNYEVGCGPIHLRNLFFRGQILGLEIEAFRDIGSMFF